jgi:predicted DsbA family dithiol-disulfide isomerase
LHPETPQEGRSLEELFAGQPVDIPAMLARLKEVARGLNLPFGKRQMTFNSRPAQELGKWAEDQGRGDAFHMAVFLAYFQRGENIALAPVLLKICKSNGLDPAAAQKVLDERVYREAVDRDWQRSRRMGIRAVPTFMIGDQRLVGARSYEALEKMLISANANRKESIDQR